MTTLAATQYKVNLSFNIIATGNRGTYMYSVPLLWLTTWLMWLLLAQQVWGQVKLPSIEFAMPVVIKVAVIITASIWYGVWG